MTKVKFFSNESQYFLEKEVNDFMKGKLIVSVSYSTNTVGYSIKHYCCVLYNAL